MDKIVRILQIKPEYFSQAEVRLKTYQLNSAVQTISNIALMRDGNKNIPKSDKKLSNWKKKSHNRTSGDCYWRPNVFLTRADIC